MQPSHKSIPLAGGGRKSAFTLVELLLALVIMAVLSVAVTTLLMGAARTDLYVSQESRAVSEAENALRRIIYNLRTASAVSSPATGVTASALTLATQPDSANGNQPYPVTYALSGTDLTESDSRYNNGATANTIAEHVSLFQVVHTSNSLITITITIGTSPAVTRSVTVYCRNL
jgi:prepilin-type N-terminal cleavage/methylation domain-containing protein